MAIYNYNLLIDFSNGINSTCLDETIQNFGFANQFDGVTVTYINDNVALEFIGSLSQADQDDLDIIVSNHDPDNCEDDSDVGIIIGAAGDASSLTLSSTNSTTPQRKLRMSTVNIPVGRYRIGWFYEFAHSLTSADFRGQVQLNESIDLMEHSQELKDSGTDQSNLLCGFAYVDLNEGNHNIDVNYWSENGTSYIKNVRLEIWRV